MSSCDSLLIYAYGGPEKLSDVPPFLASVAHGKRIPAARLESVRAHYALFDGRSPMNGAIREFLRLWREVEPQIPAYFGCRHTLPSLKSALEQMISDDCHHARVLIPAPFGGYLETYHEKLAEVRAELESEGKSLPTLNFIPPFSENPDFLEAVARTITETLSVLEEPQRRNAQLLFSVHSLPVALARSSGYESEVRVAFETLKKRFPAQKSHLGWQSASASPIPWLEPGTLDVIQDLAEKEKKSEFKTLILIPLGFPFENMEVAYDQDVEASQFAETRGFHVLRAPTIARTPEFLKMVRSFRD